MNATVRARSTTSESPYLPGLIQFGPYTANGTFVSYDHGDPFIANEAAAGIYREERNRRMLEDNRRQIAEAEERMRAHLEREASEAREAQVATG